MASIQDFTEAGHEYARQIAASNPTITTRPPSIWFAEIADKAEHDQAIEEMTLEYNLSLLDGEGPMTQQEMAEIMEVAEVEEHSCLGCYPLMLKDEEIARLSQRIEHLERENEALRAALTSQVYDRRMSVVYGVNWKLLRGRENESKKETSGSS